MENYRIDISGVKVGFPNVTVKTTFHEMNEHVRKFAGLLYEDKVLINYTAKSELEYSLKDPEMVNDDRLFSNIVTFHITEYLISGEKIPITKKQKIIS
jgi:hypothetical protein